MTKLLTIGITTYNNAPFFSELLYTLEMNFKQSPELHEYIDIVIVDDCSTDRKFIQQIEQLPKFIELIQQEQNYGTPAVGRNLIISKATSKYILFIDGDDNLLARLTTLIKELQEKDADLLVSNVRKIGNDGAVTYSPFIRSVDLFAKEEKSFDQIRKKTVHQTGIWSVYKVSYLQKHMLRYSETDRYEDNFFMVEIYMHNPEIAILQTHYYGWRNNFGSFSHQEKNYLQRLKLYEKILDRLSEDSQNIHAPWLFYSVWNQTYVNILRSYPYYSQKIYKKYYKMLEEITAKHADHVDFWFTQLDDAYIDSYTKFRKKTGIKAYVFPHTVQLIGKIWKKRYPLFMMAIATAMKPFPLQNKIFITSHYGSFNDNSKYLYLQWKKQKDQKKIKFAVKNPEKYNAMYNTDDFIDYDNKAAFFWHHYTAKHIYFNSWYNPLIRKKKGQIWTQLWHGIPYKRVYTDIKVYFETNHYLIRNQKAAAIEKWDFVHSVDAYNTKIFSSIFQNQIVIEKEYPKTEWLIENKDNMELIETLKQKYNLPADKQLVLYAPTYRPYHVYLNFKEVYSRLTEKQILLIHMHPMMQYRWLHKNEEHFNKIIRLRDIDDIQEIILCTDKIISDYSSIVHDYKKIGKPVELYQPDYQLYNEIHGLYTNNTIGE